MRILDSEVRELREMVRGAATVQNSHHAENGLRLTAIENTMLEIKVYFKVGRWVMNAVWAVLGAAGAGLAVKWFGVTKPL